MSWNILNGDCLDVMRNMDPNSIDCIVTDPPYGLHFMGKDWDSFKQKRTKGYNKPGEERKTGVSETDASFLAGTYDDRRNDEFEDFVFTFGKEALRIVKPGGHILMFGAPRRFHRQTCGLEDAGWEIRDCLMWCFGSGFPKSHNHFGFPGYGTALKPAYEPIIMAMKPLEGTYKQNAEKWGVAGINIDECRIRIEEDEREVMDNRSGSFDQCEDTVYKGHIGKRQEGKLFKSHAQGRWPANLLLDEEAAQALDQQSGMSKSSSGIKKPNDPTRDIYGKYNPQPDLVAGHSDSGGASRFFYCAKASSSERNAGLEGMPYIEKNGGNGRK
jgi:hypothetical protein